ncbi:NUDIX hydrolase [Alkalinema pantanalense CENA528]|uniref:NUDIX hydrolase n=1 Tax=Alkalinema pantanalense TaxID=1620705 RepID=UPI003D6DDB6C
MRTSRIRPIAICLFRNGQRILVSEGFDPVKQRYFCRPLGGGIEFGESSQEAIAREILEETGQAIRNIQLLGVLENRFLYNGQLGHEIVFVYDAEFVDRTLYEQGEVAWCEHDGQETSETAIARWKTLVEMQQQHIQLVPEELQQWLCGTSAIEEDPK